ncbi:hypothetical protein KW429_11045 [Vibrio fluvialis]|nr:hypothetical protein [Vibrio fluvialis]MBY7902389.1 hypothetical protein [Vibrio fluvialis]
MFQRNKSTIAVALCACLLATPSYAVVCIDATGTQLQLKEMAETAIQWARERAAWAAEYAQNAALSSWETAKQEYYASAQISSITTATSTTANAASDERYQPSPSACGTIAGIKNMVDALVSPCDNNQALARSQLLMNKIADCGIGGSGLNCGAVKGRRDEVTTLITKAVKDRDGEKLQRILDAGPNFGLGARKMSPDTEDVDDAAFDLLIGMNPPANIPRTAAGTLPDPSDEDGVLKVANWARSRVADSVATGMLIKNRASYQHVNGEASMMDRIAERVNYYDSSQFIKMVTNTNDKSKLPMDWETMHPDAKFAYLSTLPPEQQIVSSEQVIRMMAEMESLMLRIDFMSLESLQATNTLTALLVKNDL